MTFMLKNARENAGIAIEDVAKNLKIRCQYLVALEENKLSDIPGEIYAQGYLKMYASYLGINLNECHLFSPSINASSWNPKYAPATGFNNYKIAISLFLIGILSIFSWYSITEKVSYKSEEGLIDKLSKFNLDEEEGELIVIDHNIDDIALKPPSNNESESDGSL